MNHSQTFFVNGHKCEVECTGRAQWVGYLNGVKFTEASRENQVRNTLISDAKYREGVEPELDTVVEAVYDFIDQQNMWVTKSLIADELFPEDKIEPLPHKAIRLLKKHDCIRESEVMAGRNPEDMYQTTLDETPTFMG